MIETYNLSRFAGGIFKLELFLTDDYPMVPPKIRFLTKIYHPNVDKLGRICLDVLKSKWHSCLRHQSILEVREGLSLHHGRQLVTRSADPNDSLVHSSLTWRSQPGRPTRS